MKRREENATVQHSEASPSIKHILWTDYIAFFWLCVMITVSVVMIAWTPDWRGDGPVISPGLIPLVSVIAAVFICIGTIVVIWRILLLRRVLNRGAHVQGRILTIKLRRERGWVEYSYLFKGKEYQTGVSVHRTAETKELKSGDKVTVVVDKASPRRAFIHHLYIH